jgi:hypothetical protein
MSFYPLLERQSAAIEDLPVFLVGRRQHVPRSARAIVSPPLTMTLSPQHLSTRTCIVRRSTPLHRGWSSGLHAHTIIPPMFHGRCTSTNSVSLNMAQLYHSWTRTVFLLGAKYCRLSSGVQLTRTPFHTTARISATFLSLSLGQLPTLRISSSRAPQSLFDG